MCTLWYFVWYPLCTLCARELIEWLIPAVQAKLLCSGADKLLLSSDRDKHNETGWGEHGFFFCIIFLTHNFRIAETVWNFDLMISNNDLLFENDISKMVEYLRNFNKYCNIWCIKYVPHSCNSVD